MGNRRAYDSDLSDDRWALVEPELTEWRAKRRQAGIPGGRPPKYPLRDLLDAILYVDRTGIPWRYLPHDFPPWETTYHYFAYWRDEGVFARLNGLLRHQLREQAGRNPEPSAGALDAQSVKTGHTVPSATQGTDAAKKIVGRKRSILTDTLGLLLFVLVTAASVQDSVAGMPLIAQASRTLRRLRKIWVDGGYRQHLVESAARLGIDLEIVQRKPGTRGFAPIPHRWPVERTFGWIMMHRRLARDYETLPTSSEAMIYLAMIDTMARRITGEAVPTWRNPTPQDETPRPR
ncbi:IS5 family transposase [Streptomyces sp. SDr-06]|uniref:IS5 family transposase n=1 Tax=Streptomyces sp. SDr-06 TaxID=2267702 RepID=UPI000DEAAE7F|nr:IS5 family transposase [Streptomyces sp. SDr-06]RCH64282.1 IS5 family transposase [Streptomyces sp. SDr-06]